MHDSLTIEEILAWLDVQTSFTDKDETARIIKAMIAECLAKHQLAGPAQNMTELAIDYANKTQQGEIYEITINGTQQQMAKLIQALRMKFWRMRGKISPVHRHLCNVSIFVHSVSTENGVTTAKLARYRKTSCTEDAFSIMLHEAVQKAIVE